MKKYNISAYNKVVFQPALEKAREKVRKEMQVLVNQAYKDGYNTAVEKVKSGFVCKKCEKKGAS